VYAKRETIALRRYSRYERIESKILGPDIELWLRKKLDVRSRNEHLAAHIAPINYFRIPL
jgi:hypothetical protein